jgi:hypothetical protein
MGKAKDRAKNWLRRAMAMGLGLSALALSSGSLGNLSKMLDGTLAVAALLGLAVLLFEPGAARRRRTALSLALMAATLPIVARGEPLALLAAALFFLALSRAAPGAEGLVTALSITALLFAAYRILVAYLPALWHAEQWLALYFSWFAGVGLQLGPTALGLPVFALFALFALSTFLLAIQPAVPEEQSSPGTHVRHGRRHKRAALLFAAWLVALALALIAYLWLQPPLASWLVAHWPAPPTPARSAAPLPTVTYLESPLLLFALLWLLSALGNALLVPWPLVPAAVRHSGRWTLAGLGLLALGTMALSLDPPLHPNRGTILIYDSGYLAWSRPVFGQYGAHSGGAFGLLPDYLAAYGYPTRRGPLTAENLAGARAVILVNPPDRLASDEKERLLAFVRAGGGLIVWGEHTAVSDGPPPLDDLLAGLPGTPIRVKFDSAVPTRQGWAEGLTLLPHPALYDLRDPVDLVIAVGASLAIQPPARPLIVGRFGHSDAGDTSNQARNYVGDMLYNPGERLGDLVLAAEVGYGQGHIVVLGDTTPLGSVNLMTTMPFHARLLDWMTSRPAEGWHLVLRNGWLATLILFGAGYCLLRGRSQTLLAAAALVLGLALYCTTYVNERTSAPLLPRGPIAYVDASHLERFDRTLWEDTSIGGLDYSLVRNGALPLLLRQVDAGALRQAKLLVIVAPGQPFSHRKVQTIAEWVENGGRLLVSVGWEEGAASESLLSVFGLKVDNIPLGPAEVERAAGLVRFHEAWPVASERNDVRTIVQSYGYPLAVYQPWGKGGVVLIGDSQFLLGGTLEGETSFQEGNILLLRDIVQEFMGLPGADAYGAEGRP